MLLPYLHMPMGQQTFESQEKALEAAMKLKDAPKDDALGGVQQIQEKLGAMHMEIQSLWMEQGKGVSTDLWCIRCQVSGNTKDECPLLAVYL